MQRIPKERENSISQQELLMRVLLKQSVYKPQNELQGCLSISFLSARITTAFLDLSPQMMVHHHPGEPKG